MDGTMAPESAHGVALRKMSVDDIQAGLQLSGASGWNQLAEDWRVFFATPASGAFLAEKGDRAVGSAAFLRYDSFAWIAMMLVDAGERGAGIGSRLMKQVLSTLQDSTCVGLDASPMGEPLYRRFDFVPAYTLARTVAAIESARFDAPTGNARRMTADDLPSVFGRDREVFGADRSELLSSLFKRAPECASIAMESGNLRGYTFGRPGRLYYQLGPVVAEDQGTARALVSDSCGALPGRRCALDAPGLDRDWLAWLQSTGFEEERAFVRMFRRQDTHPGIHVRQYAIAGPEFA